MADSFVQLIREKSSPLSPLPIEDCLAQSTQRTQRKFRAYIFDLYGTLFISAAGDINEAAVVQAVSAEEIAFFRAAVAERHEKAKAAGSQFPEVDVAEIWGGGDAGREKALRYELAVNPVWPMPGAEEAIAHLAESGAAFGIISNAQFFSPLLFEAFFGKTAAELGFLPDLTLWSYQEKIAKPAPALFEKMKQRLAGKGIAPEDAVYIGNDMKNDIAPAADAGFSTALFAGDRRSLRMRGMELLPGRPTLVLKDLRELN